MPRAPFLVLVYPYLKAGKSEFVYALFKRADAGFWQVISGGGEDDETPLEAARRETYEETGIPKDSEFLQLDTIAPVPVTQFAISYIWGEDVYVIPQYAFGVSVKNREIMLSNEHTEYKWLNYEQAYGLVRFDDDKTALWELNRRVRGLGPRD